MSSFRVLGPKDVQDDPGTFEKLYPIEPIPEHETIIYDKYIQKSSYILASVVGAFTDWIQSFFDPNYFKMVRIRTQSPYAEFKSFMKKIYKVDKPFMVIDPQTIENDDESLFTQNMLGRFNNYDPDRQHIGAQLIYSLEVAKSDYFELVYRRNRFKFDFDIMIMEKNLDRQLNVYTNMMMNIRHNSKFMITRVIPHLIPLKYLQLIAQMHDYDYKSEEFLRFMNSVSRYPIIRRISPNGQYTFFMQQEMNLQIEVPGYPARDTPETSSAIEWGARITDNFIIRADLPAEFILMIPRKCMKRPKEVLRDDPDNISVISPVYADLDWPTEFEGFTLCNRIDIMVQEGDSHSLDIKDVIKSYDKHIYARIMECVSRNGKLSDLLMVRVYPNGSYEETGYILDNQGILTLTDPKYDKIYTANIFVNLELINMIREGDALEKIGTIEKY